LRRVLFESDSSWDRREMEVRAGADTRHGARGLRVAAVLFWFEGLAFGLPAIPVVIFLARTERLPRFLDLFAVYSGPFESFGRTVFSVLLVVFAMVCAAELVAGWLLWRERRAGGVLGLALLPVGAVFWFGFALPGPVIIAVVRTALLVRGWRRLRAAQHDQRAGSGT
jgi:hypothetical protein